MTSERRIASNVPVAPDNVGPEDDAQLRGGGSRRGRNLRGGGKTFVGPADDPFFVDLGSIFDGINIDKPGRPAIGLGNQGGGKDDVSGFNVHSFVLQVPASDVTRDGKDVKSAKAPNAVVGVWSTTERLAIPVNRGNDKAALAAGQSPREPADQRGHHPDRPEGQVQPHVARERREELRRVRAEPRAGADPQRAVQASASRRTTARTSSRRC